MLFRLVLILLVSNRSGIKLEELQTDVDRDKELCNYLRHFKPVKNKETSCEAHRIKSWFLGGQHYLGEPSARLAHPLAMDRPDVTLGAFALHERVDQ